MGPSEEPSWWQHCHPVNLGLHLAVTQFPAPNECSFFFFFNLEHFYNNPKMNIYRAEMKEQANCG